MSGTTVIPGDVRVGGNLTVGGTIPEVQRSDLTLDSAANYQLPLENFRVHDAYATVLPGTPSSDDLGLVGGTHGTGVPSIQTEDLKAAGSTDKKARITAQLPPEYVTGKTVTLRLRCKMDTTVSDTTATIDVAVYKMGDAVVDGSDLCTTAAQSINSLTAADYDFTINPAALVPGDKLDILITINVNDGATVTAVKAFLLNAELLLDIKG